MTSRNARSYFYEGLVIIASILIAFGVDAMWANYQESRVEQRMLGQLQDEFESAHNRTTASIIELEGVLAASLQLLESIGEDTDALTQEQATRLTFAMLDLNTLELPTSVIDSIVASGQIRLIGDSALRVALAEWPAYVADVRENHEWHREETDNYLVPYLSQYVSIRNSLIEGGYNVLSADTLEYEHLPMQRDAVFQGRLLWRVNRQTATLIESKILLEKTKDLLAMIESQT